MSTAQAKSKRETRMKEESQSKSGFKVPAPPSQNKEDVELPSSDGEEEDATKGSIFNAKLQQVDDDIPYRGDDLPDFEHDEFDYADNAEHGKRTVDGDRILDDVGVEPLAHVDGTEHERGHAAVNGNAGNVAAHRPAKPEDEAQDQETEQQQEPLDLPHDWAGILSRFQAAMAQNRDEDEELKARHDKLMAFYNVWRATCVQHEEERAAKRLRTRIAYVQHTETQLEQKRTHHNKVTEAFRSALALLEPEANDAAS